MDPVALVLLKLEEEPAQVIGMHQEVRVVKGETVFEVEQISQDRDADNRSMQRMLPLRFLGCIGEMQRADSAGRQAAKHFAENQFSSFRRDVLKDDHRVEEIKFSFERLQVIDRFGQRHIPEAEFLTIPLRFPEHGVRDIDAGHAFDATGERERQPADAATEIERARRREVRIEMLPDDFKQQVDVALAGFEKFAPRVAFNRRRAETRVRQHSIIGIDLAELPPILVCISHIVGLNRSKV